MKTINIFATTAAVAIFAVSAVNALAQVEIIQMHIGGDLCSDGRYTGQQAASRLDPAPAVDEIEIPDIKKGLVFFTPRADSVVSYYKLDRKVAETGCTFASAEITIIGKLERVGDYLMLTSEVTGQEFFLEGKMVAEILSRNDPSYSRSEVTGIWTTVRMRVGTHESIDPQIVTPKSVLGASKRSDSGSAKSDRSEAIKTQPSIRCVGSLSRITFQPTR